MGRQKRYPWLRGKASNGSTTAKTTDYHANSKVTRRGPPEAVPQAPYGETERAPWSKPRTFRREERTRRGPPEAVPQAPYGETERALDDVPKGKLVLKIEFEPQLADGGKQQAPGVAQ